MCHRNLRMSRICAGCGRSFSARGYNAHFSRQDTPAKCKGSDKEGIPNVSVNAHNYQVSFQVGVDDDDLPEDSEARAARAVSPRQIPGRQGPGPWPPGNMHVIVM